jgi:hypothetical protein
LPYGAVVGRDPDEVLGLAGEAVFGAEDGTDADVWCPAQNVQDVLEAAIDCRRMSDETDAQSAQRSEAVRNENIKTCAHLGHAGKLGMACRASSSPLG